MSNEVPYIPLNNLDNLYAKTPGDDDKLYAETAPEHAAWTFDEPYEGFNEEDSELVPPYPPYSHQFYGVTRHMSARDAAIAAQEPDLIQAAQRGDRDAAARFITNNLSLATYLLARGNHAARYNAIATSIEGHEDVVQVAVLGLYKALQKYDPDKGSFSRYADSCIYDHVRRMAGGGLYPASEITQSYGQLIGIRGWLSGFHKVNAYAQRKELEEWGKLSAEILQAETNFTDAEIAQYFENHYEMIPLHEAPEMEDMIDERHEATARELDATLRWAAVRPWLADRTATILYLREVEELDHERIGSRLGISRERVRRIYLTTLKEIQANPAIAHTFNLPAICNPDFPYAAKWKSSKPCPVDTFPTPEEIRRQNGINYEKGVKLMSRMYIEWLPEDLQTEISATARYADY